MHSTGAVSRPSSQRQSCSSGQCCPSSLVSTCHGSSENPSLLDRCGGWMWQVERFVAPGPPTGAGNMLRSFPWFRPSRRQNHLLVHPVPSVRTIVGVGKIGSSASPGGDRHICVLVSLAFPLVWLQSNEGGTGRQSSFFNTRPYPSEQITRAGIVCLLAATCLSSPVSS